MASAIELDRLARDLRGVPPFRQSALLLLILGCLTSAVWWASTAEIDDVTRGDGRVVPSRQVQVMQAPEGGIVHRVAVKEGEIVVPGQILFELDGIAATSQLDQERGRAKTLATRIARLQAEIEGHNFISVDEVGHDAVLAAEAALFSARATSVEAEIAVLELQRHQRVQEAEEGEAERDAANEALELVNEEIALIAPLVEQRLEPGTTLLALRRQEAELRGRERRSAAAVERLSAALAEIDNQIEAVRARYRSDAVAELSAATAEALEVAARLPALEDRVARAVIHSPVRGIVNRVLLTTEGAVAQSGEPLVEIVPLDDTLLVEAWLRPADIAFLRPSQPVRVQITAYDFARYGALEGEIVRIGADAVTRPDTNEPAFVVTVRTHSAILDAEGTAVEIVPGMVAQVDILTGRKTVLDYLIRPVVRVKDTAFRD